MKSTPLLILLFIGIVILWTSLQGKTGVFMASIFYPQRVNVTEG
jgi:hypothetical protein